MKTKIIATAQDFARKHNFSFELYEFKKNQLWGETDKNESKNWAKFEMNPGFYVISNKTNVVYIGKSITNTGGRLFLHFQNDEKMRHCDENTDIIVFSFLVDRHFTSALESFLIEEFKTIENKKIG